MTTENKLSRHLIYIAIATIFLLMIPLIAMQFSTEVNWTFSDFLFAGTLLFGTGLTFKIVTRNASSNLFKIASASALGSGLFLIWANGAVGIIGSENNDFNILYFLVIFVGIIGLFASQLKAWRLFLTLFAMAATQLILTIIAIFTGMAELPHSSVSEIIAVNGFFITWFIVSALLFKYADEKGSGEQS
jgi:hypothetical protein